MKAFFDNVRRALGPLSQSQVDGFNVILEASAGLPVSHRAYLLATAWHETGAKMQPIREAYGRTDDDTIRRLDKAWAAGQLTWVKAPYWRKDGRGRAWFGRGYVQLTHEANYKRAGDSLGVDLVGNPSLAMKPDIAAAILVKGSVEGWFRKDRSGPHKLARYLPGDYRAARNIINGDVAHVGNKIAGYATAFESAIRAAGGATPRSGTQTPGKPTSPPASAPRARGGIVGGIIAAALAIAAFIAKKLGMF